MLYTECISMHCIFFSCPLENIEPYNCRKSEFDIIENVN